MNAAGSPVAVRALVFDVFGTLVDWRSGVADAFRASGLSGDPEELADAWRARYGPILSAVNEGRRPWGNFDQLHLATLDDVLAERGLDLTDEAVDGRIQRASFLSTVNSGSSHGMSAYASQCLSTEALLRRSMTPM